MVCSYSLLSFFYLYRISLRGSSSLYACPLLLLCYPLAMKSKRELFFITLSFYSLSSSSFVSSQSTILPTIFLNCSVSGR